MRGDSIHRYLLYIKKVKLGNRTESDFMVVKGLSKSRDLNGEKEGSDIKDTMDEEQGRPNSQCIWPSV